MSDKKNPCKDCEGLGKIVYDGYWSNSHWNYSSHRYESECEECLGTGDMSDHFEPANITSFEWKQFQIRMESLEEIIKKLKNI